MIGTRVGWLLGLVAATLCAIGAEPVAATATAACATGWTSEGGGCQLSDTTAGSEMVSVPAGVSTLSVTVVGAPGGNEQGSSCLHDPGGLQEGVGGVSTGTLVVTAESDTLTLSVGGAGQSPNGGTGGAGGSGGGGAGGSGGSGGGGGGGASYLSGGAGLLLAAGGGGGGAGVGDGGYDGGNGAGASSSGGYGCPQPLPSPGSNTPFWPGGGGTQSAGGAAGFLEPDGGITAAGSGTGPMGNGGSGGSGEGGITAGGGGGGGGYYGGGGGGASENSGDVGAGGGGSGYGNSAFVTDIGYGTDGSLVPKGEITLSYAGASGLVVNSTADTPDPSSSLTAGSCNTTPSASTATCTLRAAIQVADAEEGGRGDTITFNVPTGNGNTFDGDMPEIEPASNLPQITATVTIDGASEPGAGKVEINGTNIPDLPCTATDAYPPQDASNSGGFDLGAGSNGSVIEGMVINNVEFGIGIGDSGAITIQGDRFGTDPTGTRAEPVPPGLYGNDCPGAGVVISDSNGVLIGGTQAGQGNVISGNANSGIGVEDSTGLVIEGDTIGPALGGNTLLEPPLPVIGNVQLTAITINNLGVATGGGGAPLVIGGTGLGAGNTIAGAIQVQADGVDFEDNSVRDDNVFSDSPEYVHAPDTSFDGQDDTIRGNSFTDNTNPVDVSATESMIGGPASTPGTGLGNTFDDTSLTSGGANTTIAGNAFVGRSTGTPYALDLVSGAGQRVGGVAHDLGNLIAGAPVGIEVDRDDNNGAILGSSGDSALIESNTITGSHQAGVLVANDEDDDGVHITDNSMTGNLFGIVLGGAGYVYNGGAGAPIGSSGPNDYQPYPVIDSATKVHGGVALTTELNGSTGEYTLDIYSQPSCAEDSITPGEGRVWITEDAIAGDGGTPKAIRLPAVSGAITLTATSANGSTSEFSPCLTIGHKAASFTHDGVTFPNPTATATSPSAGTSLARIAAAKTKAKTVARLTAKVSPFCPPVTSGHCTGTISLTTKVKHHSRSTSVTVARLKFRLDPDAIGTLAFRLSSTITKLLEHDHRLTLLAKITAHDNAKPVHHKHLTTRITLRLATSA